MDKTVREALREALDAAETSSGLGDDYKAYLQLKEAVASELKVDGYEWVHIGGSLRQARVDAGVSLRALAARVGITVVQLGKIELGLAASVKPEQVESKERAEEIIHKWFATEGGLPSIGVLVDRIAEVFNG